MSQNKYKLTYFNARGWGELPRWLFALADIPFEDNRVEYDQWPVLKPKAPFGQLPLLEVNGEGVFSQSSAIARYIAREHGLAGKNSLESAKADAVANFIYDLLYIANFTWRRERDATAREEQKNKFENEILHVGLDLLSRNLSDNGGTYFVGDDTTWADLAAANFFEEIKWLFPTALDTYPLLKAHAERILSLPRIKEWLEKRPHTNF